METMKHSEILTVRVPPPLADAVKQEAAREARPVSNFLRLQITRIVREAQVRRELEVSE